MVSQGPRETSGDLFHSSVACREHRRRHCRRRFRVADTDGRGVVVKGFTLSFGNSVVVPFSLPDSVPRTV